MLQGVGVLVTRPEQQATPLCSLLEAAGATVTRLPAIAIEAAGDGSAGWGSPADYDLIVFTSANAVRFGAALLAPRSPPPLAAIGPATARALAAAGFTVTITPSAGFDSDSLLRELRRTELRERRVLLVKGVSGREHLQDQLAELGALVSVAEVYRRVPLPPDAPTLRALEAALSAGSIHVVTATSAEIAGNLVALATPTLRDAFERIHWLVPGIRVAAAIRARGVSAPLIQADSAEDHDLVSALVRWHGGA